MRRQTSYKLFGKRYPTTDKIKGRISTVARSMWSTIAPRKKVSITVERDIHDILFGQGEVRCVYCGKPMTHLDHLYPLITNKHPSGYFSEPANLVPCCSECNQKKAGQNWQDYMKSSLCPDDGEKSKRIERLLEFQRKYRVHQIDSIKSDEFKELWDKHYKTIEEALLSAQKALEEFRNNHSDFNM